MRPLVFILPTLALFVSAGCEGRGSVSGSGGSNSNSRGIARIGLPF